MFRSTWDLFNITTLLQCREGVLGIMSSVGFPQNIYSIVLCAKARKLGLIRPDPYFCGVSNIPFGKLEKGFDKTFTKPRFEFPWASRCRFLTNHN